MKAMCTDDAGFRRIPFAPRQVAPAEQSLHAHERRVRLDTALTHDAPVFAPKHDFRQLEPEMDVVVVVGHRERSVRPCRAGEMICRGMTSAGSSNRSAHGALGHPAGLLMAQDRSRRRGLRCRPRARRCAPRSRRAAHTGAMAGDERRDADLAE